MVAWILSPAKWHTHFLDSPLIASSLSRWDFTLGEVAEQCGSVFLILPSDRIHGSARCLRLLVGRAMVKLMRDTGTQRPRFP